MYITGNEQRVGDREIEQSISSAFLYILIVVFASTHQDGRDGHDAHPMGVLVSAMGTLSVFHPDANPAVRGQDLYKSRPVRDRQIVLILGKGQDLFKSRPVRDRQIVLILGKEQTQEEKGSSSCLTFGFLQNPKTDLPSKNEVTLHETNKIPTENGNSMETHDKDIMVEGLGLVGVYDQWVDPPVSGQRPKPRFEHAAAVIDDKMYIFGGNHNGRYLNDLQTLDLRNWTWSKVEVKPNSEFPVTTTPCAGHSLIPWEGNKLISIAGHSKDPSEVINVKAFDLQTNTWSPMKTYGKSPGKNSSDEEDLNDVPDDDVSDPCGYVFKDGHKNEIFHPPDIFGLPATLPGGGGGRDSSMKESHGRSIFMQALHSQCATILMADGDTFRAAASDQLGIWAERTGCEIVLAEKEKAKAPSM
ncbi:hypothetical protein L1887_32388 [Cichorium endivia]|nr:hypothetical protein L1887_32388 [Cichorium endivia]